MFSAGRRIGRITAAAVIVAGLAVAVSSAPPASADGATTCTTGSPPDGYAGFCGTFNGDNTWFGSYGPGLSTPLGWGLCAHPAAGGGDYPEPDDDYRAASPPAGAQTNDDGPLGFALSMADAGGAWSGSWQAGDVGEKANLMAAAAKLLYDRHVWGTVPADLNAPAGLSNDYDTLTQWYDDAASSSSAPVVTSSIPGGGSTINDSTVVTFHVAFPGTGAPLPGVGLIVTVRSAGIDPATMVAPAGSTGATTTTGLSTDASGNASVTVYANSVSSLEIDAAASVGNFGLSFYGPTAHDLGAQIVAAVPAPSVTESSQTLNTNSLFAPPLAPAASPTLGALTLLKSVNDAPYYGPGGAVFGIYDSANNLVTTITTSVNGTAGPVDLPDGTYVVHELTPPSGYGLAPDQTAVVTGTATTEVDFTGVNGDQVIPGALTITKVDQQSDAPLAGAVFDVTYDASGSNIYNVDVGTCITDAAGACSPPDNDGTGLLPGNYRVTEITAPPGYWLNPSIASQVVSVTPGQSVTAAFSDETLGRLTVVKSGDDESYATVTGATFTLSGPAPSTATVGTLVVGAGGNSNTLSDLAPGSYTVAETAAPAGYQVAPVQTVAVAAGTTTTVNVLDRVSPATLTIEKVDAQTNAPLAGAVFDVAYDQTNNGHFTDDLGDCTTTASGSCSPNGNDGSMLLPGNYQVTEVQAPDGYAIDDQSQTINLAPGQVGQITFKDALLVAARFAKSATGNVNQSLVDLAGARFALTAASGGAVVADCSTDSSGSCATPATLAAGQSYCWVETTAPAGLVSGAHGCFTADNTQGDEPIDVADAGAFVAIGVIKDDSTNTSVQLPGALIDLYRVDNGAGPSSVPVPAGVPTETGETFVGQATTGSDGEAIFPLQFPGYAYCGLEQTAPANYVLNPIQMCTGVVTGTTTVPAPVHVIRLDDAEQMITLAAHKFNSLQPDSTIPGAVYDLFSEGSDPPSAPALSAAPTGDRAPSGDTWFARGTTSADGVVDFAIPAGYHWCLHEVLAPAGYQLDPGWHCTGLLTTDSPSTATTVALPETPTPVALSAHKFNAQTPDTSVAGASYELLGEGAADALAVPTAPVGAIVPTGDWYFARGTTNEQGLLSFTVPSGFRWCLHELSVPAGYELDPSFHCTDTLVATDPTPVLLALAESPAPVLAFTGFNPDLAVVGLAATVVGAGLWLWAGFERRRRTRRRA